MQKTTSPSMKSMIFGTWLCVLATLALLFYSAILRTPTVGTDVAVAVAMVLCSCGMVVVLKVFERYVQNHYARQNQRFAAQVGVFMELVEMIDAPRG